MYEGRPMVNAGSKYDLRKFHEIAQKPVSYSDTQGTPSDSSASYSCF